MTTGPLRWGIIGTGRSAHTVAAALCRSRASRLVAVASRTAQSAAKFCAEYGLTRGYASYDQLLCDPEIDIVYIATPHSTHARWAVRAARARKHVLCEKPLAMDHAEVSAVVRAARDNDVFLMEAFMYRCHPQTSELVALVRSGAIGRVKAIQASFGTDGVYAPGSRMITNALGGGGILDLGCYPVSMARLLAGVAVGQAFCDPLEVHAVGHVGERSAVDEYTLAVLKFPAEILASLATSLQLWQENSVRVFGSTGRLFVADPWHPSPLPGSSEITIERPGKAVERIRIPATETVYDYEIAAVSAQIERRQAQQMTLADSLGNALTLDRWRSAIGVTYTAEPAAPGGAYS